MTNSIGPSFRKIKNDIYKNHADGFYVRAKPNLCTPDITIKYISRYLGRPVIATSRIDKYDGEMVNFHYTRHEDDKTIEECVPAMDFIKRLIIHIPEKHFIKRTLDWRNSIILSFEYNPLHCDTCGTSLLVLEVYHKSNIDNVMANLTHSLFCYALF